MDVATPKSQRKSKASIPSGLPTGKRNVKRNFKKSDWAVNGGASKYNSELTDKMSLPAIDNMSSISHT